MVVTVDFSLRAANNLVFRLEPELIPLVVNRRFQLPEEAVLESVSVMLNGQVLDRLSDNGFVVVSPTVVELKVLKRVSDVLQVSYLKA